MELLGFVRSNALALPKLAKFAIAMAIIVGIPALSRRSRLPTAVVLLLSGVLIGPRGLALFGEKAPVADFFADLGKLLLMFFAGLEIDLEQFRKAQNRSILCRAFAYPPAARLTMWSLTLPQVAATLAATLVGFDTFNLAGQRLLDGRVLNAVLVLMLTTSILGPVLTEYFAPLLLEDVNGGETQRHQLQTRTSAGSL
jgi:Kef-type K+ transport system membrane component KefB